MVRYKTVQLTVISFHFFVTPITLVSHTNVIVRVAVGIENNSYSITILVVVTTLMNEPTMTGIGSKDPWSPHPIAVATAAASLNCIGCLEYEQFFLTILTSVFVPSQLV